MSPNEKIKTTHPQRLAFVYVWQSTTARVQHNRESTDRQYKLAQHAVHLGWAQSQVRIIDEDLARSGSGTSHRGDFTTMTTEVALGHVGLILSIEVSRVARNSTKVSPGVILPNIDLLSQSRLLHGRTATVT
ncbi:hypothetical protein ACFL0Q_03175 [Thermodesulfobacteriota bacterium]